MVNGKECNCKFAVPLHRTPSRPKDIHGPKSGTILCPRLALSRAPQSSEVSRCFERFFFFLFSLSFCFSFCLSLSLSLPVSLSPASFQLSPRLVLLTHYILYLTNQNSTEFHRIPELPKHSGTEVVAQKTLRYLKTPVYSWVVLSRPTIQAQHNRQP